MKTLSILLTVLFVSALLSCSSTVKKREPVIAAPAYGELFQKAKKDFQKKDYTRGLQKFNKIIREVPESELAAESHMVIGDHYTAQGKTEEACQSYDRVVNSPVKTRFESPVGIKVAQCLYHLDKLTDALARVDISLNDPELQKDLLLNGLKLRLLILKRMNFPLEELKTNLHLYVTEENEATKREYRIAAISIAESSLTTAQLEEVANDSKYSFTQPAAMFRLGVSSFEKSEFGRARSYFSDVIRLSPNTEIAERSAELMDQIDARETVNPQRIGVILPLTGKLAKIGYKTLRGIQLGLNIFGKNRSRFELAVIDSGGNASTARRAVEKLVTEDHVVAILGSLSSKEASVIATKSQEFGVPTIVLSQKSGITEIGDYVFRNALTSEMQVKQLVSEAMSRGLKRFAILYPQDAYGSEYANLFWDEVIKQGGELRGIQSYKSGETDFNVPIRKLIGTHDPLARNWEYKTRYEEWKKTQSPSARKKQPEDLLPPIVDFDAIFIPDSAKSLGQVAPMLTYNDVVNVQLIGTNLWNTPSIIERAGKFLKDSFFVDSFLAADPQLTNSEFYRNYAQTFGENPEEFELQAYDSALILRKVLVEGAGNRADVQRSLASLRQLPGAVGQLSMSEAREVARPLVVLTIKDDQIVRAATTPTSKN